MSLRVLLYAGLRVYAIYYVVQILTLIPFVAQMMLVSAPEVSMAGSYVMNLVASGIVAALLWFSAPRLAAAIIRNSEPTIDKFALTLENVYTLTFVFLGLYFVLSSLASFLQQLYYLVAVVAQLPQDAPERTKAVFNIYRPGITLIAGGASLLGAPWWARKLTQWSSRLPN